MDDIIWLKYIIPAPTQAQIEYFLESVGKRVEHLTPPSQTELEQARFAAYQDLLKDKPC